MYICATHKHKSMCHGPLLQSMVKSDTYQATLHKNTLMAELVQDLTSQMRKSRGGSWYLPGIHNRSQNKGKWRNKALNPSLCTKTPEGQGRRRGKHIEGPFHHVCLGRATQVASLFQFSFSMTSSSWLCPDNAWAGGPECYGSMWSYGHTVVTGDPSHQFLVMGTELYGTFLIWWHLRWHLSFI